MSPRHMEVTRDSCPAVRDILSRVGDKWSVLVIGLLRSGPKRFSELRRTIPGVSQRMLTLTLRGLERDGLVRRTVYPSIPPRVDYELSKLGRTIIKPVLALARWAIEHREEIETSRATRDAEKARLGHAGTQFRNGGRMGSVQKPTGPSR